LIKTDEPAAEEPTADSEPSLTSEFLSFLEYGLTCLTEEVQNWQKQVAECEQVKRQMDAAMGSYKISRNQEDAVQVLELVDKILGSEYPCFGATESAVMNAVLIARDKTGLPNHDKPKKPYDYDGKSKGYELGLKLGRWFKRFLSSKGYEIPDVNIL
jgi:hypothetical protein